MCVCVCVFMNEQSPFQRGHVELQRHFLSLDHGSLRMMKALMGNCHSPTAVDSASTLSLHRYICTITDTEHTLFINYKLSMLYIDPRLSRQSRDATV